MGEAGTIPVEVMLPVDDAAEDVASDVATALNALCERLDVLTRDEWAALRTGEMVRRKHALVAAEQGRMVLIRFVSPPNGE